MKNQSSGGSNQSFIMPGYALPFILVTSLFFMWAIPHNLNDVLIKQTMKVFAINRMGAGFIQTAFYLGYFLLAIPAAMLMKKYTYKTGLVTGLILYFLGCLMMLPAAMISKYFAFLVALFTIAAGLSFFLPGDHHRFQADAGTRARDPGRIRAGEEVAVLVLKRNKAE